MPRLLSPLLLMAGIAAAFVFPTPAPAALTTLHPPTAAPVAATEETPSSTITIQVTARRWEEPLQEIPESVSVVSQDILQGSGMLTVRDTARQVPNLTLPDFSARWLTFPYIRGIGSGRNSPAVTTVIDGVPQLSYATGSTELLDVDHVEFLRGPQGSLYGRNTLGGVVNVIPSLPTDTFSAQATGTLGDYGLRDIRAGVSGPLGASGLLGGLSLGDAVRDGFTTNDTTGHKLDNHDAEFGHAQLYLPSEGPWNLRFSMTAERDRDGDYALGDLAALRANPFHVNHDFEGFNNRDVTQPVFTAVRQGKSAEFTSITALQGWKVRDATDADFSPVDLLRQGTNETQNAWLQEFRVASPANSTLAMGRHMTARWLLGALLFTDQDSSDNFTGFSTAAAAGEGVPVPFTQHAIAQLRNSGINPYGQLGLSWDQRWDLTLGLRHDYEHKTANLQSSTDPTLSPATTANDARDFNQTSPQVSLGYHLTPHALWYATLANGYKTGGFNPQAPAGKTVYGAETSHNYETGVKSSWLQDRLIANLCLFRLDWNNMQLDVATTTPSVFFIDNVGKASSQGGELELTARPLSGLELTGGAGILDTRFKAGSTSQGADISNHRLPFAPPVTLHAGAQYSRKIVGRYTGTARLDLLNTGKYYYDATNAASQGNYTLVNLHLGVERGQWRAMGWANNLFNKHYVPVAYPVPLPTVSSGYVGESGAPRTIGLTVGYAFP